MHTADQTNNPKPFQHHTDDLRLSQVGLNEKLDLRFNRVIFYYITIFITSMILRST